MISWRTVEDAAGFGKVEAHYTKVLVVQGCAPPNSALPQVGINEGLMH